MINDFLYIDNVSFFFFLTLQADEWTISTTVAKNELLAL